MFSLVLLICLVSAIYFAMTIFNLRLALAVFVALLPVYVIRFAIPLPIGPLAALPSTLLEILFGVLCLGWLLNKLRDDKAPRSITADLRPWAYGLVLLMLGAIIGITVSASPVAALGLWRAYFMEPFLFFFIFVDLVRDAKARRMILTALGTTIIAIGIIIIIQKITGWWIPNPVWVPATTRRVTALYGYPNAIGLMAAPITMLMFAWFTASVRRLRSWRDLPLPIFTASATILGALAILFAVSEGAMFGLLAGLVVFGLCSRHLRWPTVGAIIIASIIVVSYAPLRHYAELKLTANDDSWNVRKIVWSESLNMLRDHPIFGAGLDGYQSALVPYHQATYIEIFMYPHNVVLNFWSETGVIGLIGFLTLIVSFFIITVRLVIKYPNEWLPLALVAAMIALLVHGLVDVPYFKNDLAMLFFVLLGLAESLRRATGTKLTSRQRHDIF